jgi:hypothetical protein
MKKYILAAVLAVTAVTTQAAVPLTLLSFGTSTYTLDGSSTAGPTQSASGFAYSNAVISLGDTFFNSPGGLSLAVPNWTTYKTNLNLYLSVTAISASTPFTLTLYDDQSATVDYSGTASSTSGVLTEVPLTLTPNVAFNFANIQGVQLTWGGGATAATASIQAVTSVPEPSTYALLGMGAVALSGYVVRRRRRA